MISCRNTQKFGLQILMLNTATLTLGAQIQTNAVERITKKRHNHFEKGHKISKKLQSLHEMWITGGYAARFSMSASPMLAMYF